MEALRAELEAEEQALNGTSETSHASEPEHDQSDGAISHDHLDGALSQAGRDQHASDDEAADEDQAPPAAACE